MKIREDISYRLRLEWAIIFSILLILVFLNLYPTFEFNRELPDSIQINIVIEDVPPTRQGRLKPPPPRPIIPIPSEDDPIPEDEIITKFQFNTDYTNASNENVGGMEVISTIPARLIKEVIPEYPSEDYSRGVTGYVKLHIHIDDDGGVTDVVVLENTTGSLRCADAAKAAALKCKYQPARRGGKVVGSWMSRIIKFDIK